jgi:predicted nucleic-acid-binding Zn-ribbon protein
MFGATSCGKCDGSSFKLHEVTVTGAAYRMYAVQCTSCGTPIGVTEFFDNGSLLKKQEKAIADLQSKVSGMSHTIDQIAHVLNQMARR